MQIHTYLCLWCHNNLENSYTIIMAHEAMPCLIVTKELRSSTTKLFVCSCLFYYQMITTEPDLLASCLLCTLKKCNDLNIIWPWIFSQGAHVFRLIFAWLHIQDNSFTSVWKSFLPKKKKCCQIHMTKYYNVF